MAYYMGADVGSSSIKGIIIQDSGKIIKTTSKMITTYHPNTGYYEQDPLGWWNSFQSVVKTLLNDMPEKIKSLSVSGQMHTIVTLDKNDKPVRPAIMWSDQRSFHECNELMNQFCGEEKFIDTFGNSLFPGFSASIIHWIKKNEPENFKKSEKFLLPKDFINYQLTGKHVSELSDLSGTCMVNINNKKFEPDFLDILGVSLESLPEILISGQFIDYCKNTALPQLHGVPLIMGGADNACTLLGNGVVEPGQGLISLGTSGTIIGIPENPQKDRSGSIHLFRQASDDGFYHMAVLLSASSSLEWLKNMINPELTYSEITKKVNCSSPGSNGLLFLPHLNGDRFPGKNPKSRGVFFGLNALHTQNDLFRSVFEGIIFALKEGEEFMEKMGTNFNEIVITGGGAKNDLWCQITSDIFQKPIKRLNKDFGPHMGAALIARNFPDNKPLKLMCNCREFFPNQDFRELFNNCFERYKMIYQHLKSDFSNNPLIHI